MLIELIQRFSDQFGVTVVIALMAVGTRLLFASERWTALGVIRGVVVGLFVGLHTQMYLADLVPPLADGVRGATIALAAILAEDLIVLILYIGRSVRNNPSQIIDLLLRNRK